MNVSARGALVLALLSTGCLDFRGLGSDGDHSAFIVECEDDGGTWDSATDTCEGSSGDRAPGEATTADAGRGDAGGGGFEGDGQADFSDAQPGDANGGDDAATSDDDARAGLDDASTRD